MMKEPPVNEGLLLTAIFELVERVTGAEITNSARKLIIEYYREAPGATPSERARQAVRRYAQWEPPSLDEIRERNQAGTMEDADWRVLKVEYLAAKLGG
jgi:hypothetical protein